MTTLRHAVAASSPAHAYLFTGPRGTGKTSTGRILAKAVNCTAPVDGEPDNACDSCRAFSEGRALDLIELDAASNRGIDEVRALRESVGYSPNAATYKVYLVDEVHMLTDAAFNALLKTLEEPPPHVIFVLATTEPHRIPPTISSRCQRFDFRRIALPDIVERLHAIAAGEGIQVADGCMELIARQAGGSLRDAVNLLDQLVAYHGTSLDLDAVQRGLGLVVDDRAAELARAAIERDLAAGLALLSAVRDDGIEVRAFVREVVNMLRTLLLLRAGARDGLDLSDGQLAELTPIAEQATAARHRRGAARRSARSTSPATTTTRCPPRSPSPRSPSACPRSATRSRHRPDRPPLRYLQCRPRKPRGARPPRPRRARAPKPRRAPRSSVGGSLPRLTSRARRSRAPSPRRQSTRRPPPPPLQGRAAAPGRRRCRPTRGLRRSSPRCATASAIFATPPAPSTTRPGRC